MAYPYYGGGYQGGYYQPPMPDQLSQLRGQTMQLQPYGTQQPINPQQSLPPQNTNQQFNNNMIWVQGEEGAKAYLVGNGNTVVLWDSENQTIYIKSADISGIPSMRVLDWTERIGAHKTPLQCSETKRVEYITRDEFNALQARIDGFMNENAIDKTNKTTKSAKKEE